MSLIPRTIILPYNNYKCTFRTGFCTLSECCHRVGFVCVCVCVCMCVCACARGDANLSENNNNEIQRSRACV